MRVTLKLQQTDQNQFQYTSNLKRAYALSIAALNAVLTIHQTPVFFIFIANLKTSIAYSDAKHDATK